MRIGLDYTNDLRVSIGLLVIVSSKMSSSKFGLR